MHGQGRCTGFRCPARRLLEPQGPRGRPVLSGIWRNPDTGRQLPVNLALKGRRPLEKRPEAPFEALNPLYSNTGVSGDPPVVSAASLPYDMLKMTVPLKAGPTQHIGGATLRMDTDSRVGMDYPVVVKLAGVDFGPLNAYLAQQRLQAQMPAFSCLSYAYLGFGWNGQEAGGTNGFDGNWSVTTEHLTPRLMGSWNPAAIIAAAPILIISAITALLTR